MDQIRRLHAALCHLAAALTKPLSHAALFTASTHSCVETIEPAETRIARQHRRTAACSRYQAQVVSARFGVSQPCLRSANTSKCKALTNSIYFAEEQGQIIAGACIMNVGLTGELLQHLEGSAMMNTNWPQVSSLMGTSP